VPSACFRQLYPSSCLIEVRAENFYAAYRLKGRQKTCHVDAWKDPLGRHSRFWPPPDVRILPDDCVFAARGRGGQAPPSPPSCTGKRTRPSLPGDSDLFWRHRNSSSMNEIVLPSNLLNRGKRTAQVFCKSMALGLVLHSSLMYGNDAAGRFAIENTTSITLNSEEVFLPVHGHERNTVGQVCVKSLGVLAQAAVGSLPAMYQLPGTCRSLDGRLQLGRAIGTSQNVLSPNPPAAR